MLFRNRTKRYGLKIESALMTGPDDNNKFKGGADC